MKPTQEEYNENVPVWGANEEAERVAPTARGQEAKGSGQPYSAYWSGGPPIQITPACKPGPLPDPQPTYRSSAVVVDGEMSGLDLQYRSKIRT